MNAAREKVIALIRRFFAGGWLGITGVEAVTFLGLIGLLLYLASEAVRQAAWSLVWVIEEWLAYLLGIRLGAMPAKAPDTDGTLTFLTLLILYGLAGVYLIVQRSRRVPSTEDYILGRYGAASSLAADGPGISLSWFLGVLAVISGASFLLLFAGDVLGNAVMPRGSGVFLLLASLSLILATICAIYLRYGQRPALLVVQDGNVRRVGARDTGLKPGQRVSMLVESGQVVILEKFGQFSRILEPGLADLEPGERVRKVILTGPRTLVGTLECNTRDGIPIAVGYQVVARILPGGDDMTGIAPPAGTVGTVPLRVGQQITPAIPYSRQAILRAAYESHNWEAEVLTSARSLLREQLARMYLDEIYDYQGLRRGTFPLADIQDRIRVRLGEVSRQWGAMVTQFQITHIRVPPQILDAVISAWHAKQQTGALPLRTAADEEAAKARRLQQESKATVNIMPVVERGPAGSLRELLRLRAAEIQAGGVFINGQPYAIQPLGPRSPSEIALRRDHVYFSIQALGGNILDPAIQDGDYIVFEAQDFASHEDLVAVLIDRQVSIRRFLKKLHHILLEPETADMPLIAVADDDHVIEELRQQYGAAIAGVDFKAPADIRIIGKAVLVLKRIWPDSILNSPFPPEGRGQGDGE